MSLYKSAVAPPYPLIMNMKSRSYDFFTIMAVFLGYRWHGCRCIHCITVGMASIEF